MVLIRCAWQACTAAGILVIGFALVTGAARANSENILYTFKGGKDGNGPSAGVIVDAAGNLYGTTQDGGSRLNGGYGCGTAFKLAPDGSETVLHAFRCGDDGMYPSASLVLDNQGNLYGTTVEGGIDKRDCGFGCGTVFEIAADGQKFTLYDFRYRIAASPDSGLVMDGVGPLYGTTRGGANYGTVYKTTVAGKTTVIYGFKGGSDGTDPEGGVIRDKDGNLYGTTHLGGNDNCPAEGDCGTVFKVAPDGTKTTLYDFKGGNDGSNPFAGLVRDKSGNFYGTTLYGGSACGGGGGCGTVFKLAPDGTESVLHAFTGGSDGMTPSAGLVIDKLGNLYGTTYQGGGTGCYGQGCGTIFEVAADGTETILHAFTFGKDGAYPLSTLLWDGHDRLLGTASAGGNSKCHCGVVFSIKK